MVSYKSFDNDINGICNPLLTNPRDFDDFCFIANYKYTKLPPHPTKITYNCKVFPRVFANH